MKLFLFVLAQALVMILLALVPQACHNPRVVAGQAEYSPYTADSVRKVWQYRLQVSLDSLDGIPAGCRRDSLLRPVCPDPRPPGAP